MRELHTGMYIHDPLDIEELWNFATVASLTFDGHGRTLADCPYKTGRENSRSGVMRRELDLDPDSPLYGDVAMWYRHDMPVQTIAETEEVRRKCPNRPRCTNDDRHSPAHHVLLGMTTSYMYADARGWDVSDLHAAMIWSIGGFLNTKDVSWSWSNELTDRFHYGVDALGEPLDKMKELGKQAAMDARSEFLHALGLPSPWDSNSAGVIIVDAAEAIRQMFGDQDD